VVLTPGKLPDACGRAQDERGARSIGLEEDDISYIIVRQNDPLLVVT
jgi:hypothetical protein